ncbi:MAG: YigZ family protein [Blautia sp.]|nr:YigZ family protein [Blautia sp.]MDY5030710.1 YigZ family protein [Blautia sp.]
MLERYKTIYTGGEGEIIEKKSRFIATVRPVKTEEEALAFIEEMRKKYWDARHNCYVYSIGKNREFTRCSDDGEPSGTAGRPMLDVILGTDLYDVAVVVTRYFGGILLGTGGLVRAYSGAVQAGLAESTIIEKIHGVSLEVTTDYMGIGKIQYIAGERRLPILDSEYTDKVVLHLMVPAHQEESVRKAITEGTNGRAKLSRERELYFADLDGEVLVFDDEIQ